MPKTGSTRQFLFRLTLLALIAGCGDGRVPFTIKGTLVDRQARLVNNSVSWSTKRVPGVLVEVPLAGASTVTDSEGRFLLKGRVTPGCDEVRYSKSGKRTLHTWEVLSRDIASIDILGQQLQPFDSLHPGDDSTARCKAQTSPTAQRESIAEMVFDYSRDVEWWRWLAGFAGGWLLAWITMRYLRSEAAKPDRTRETLVFAISFVVWGAVVVVASDGLGPAQRSVGESLVLILAVVWMAVLRIVLGRARRGKPAPQTVEGPGRPSQ